MDYIKEFDRQVISLIRFLPARWRPLMQGLSFLGEPPVVIAAGLAGYLAASIRGREASQKAFIYALLAYGIGVGLKHVFRRGRPGNLKIQSLSLKSYGFPSGHAFGSLIFYGLFAVIDARGLLFPWDVLSVTVIWAVILLIGISRIYLKSHYPSDVVGGWLFGAAALVIIAQTALK